LIEDATLASLIVFACGSEEAYERNDERTLLLLPRGETNKQDMSFASDLLGPKPH
jgi:hypothetical protein